MKEVSKQDFYSSVGPRDVVLGIEGAYPYTSVFKTRSGRVVGKIANSAIDPRLNRYYLNQD